MSYDSDNDRLINDDESLQLKPSQVYWHSSHSIEIEIGEDFISLPTDQIDDLIEGLLKAKELTNK